MTTTNDLRHTITTHDKDGNDLIIEIRLNETGKNGHEDFAITGTGYKKGRKGDSAFLYGGCCHEDILAVRPDLALFVRLHLADADGVPMYAIANGFYHLENGFNNTPPLTENFKAEFCEYYRLTPEQFDTLKDSRNKMQYGIKLIALNVLKQWKEEANEAIAILEKWTGKKFESKATKSNFDAPTPEMIQQEEEKIKNGYYTPQAEEERKQAGKAEVIAKLRKEADKEILKAENEFLLKSQVYEIGGQKALDNCIYYSHSNTLAFNWKGYDKISDELIHEIKSKIKLPEGCKIENKD